VELLEFALIITIIMTAAVLQCSCHHQTDIKLSWVVALSTTLVFWNDGPGRLAVTDTSGVLRTPDKSITSLHGVISSYTLKVINTVMHYARAATV
jgi:hypothetical protein